MAQRAFLASDYAFAPTNRVVDALEDVRDVLIIRMEQASIIAADCEEHGDTHGFDCAMRSFAAFRVAVEDVTLRMQTEQRGRS